MKTTTAPMFLSFALSCGSAALADTFGSGANTFDVEFVTIGNPGKAPDDASAASLRRPRR